MVHDKSFFSSYDGKRTVWVRGDGHPIRPKGQGRSIMVSEFLCECHGRLKLTADMASRHPDLPKEATVIIFPGKNADGYWNNSDLVKRTTIKVMPLFKVLHPDCDALIMFENSQNHHAFAPDALVENRLNKRDGGKRVHLTRRGWYYGKSGEKIDQFMQNHKGEQKGLQTILMERDLWPLAV